jgi:hypothetical protein
MRKEKKKLAHLITRGEVVLCFGIHDMPISMNLRKGINITPKQVEALKGITVEFYNEIWAKFNAKRDERIKRLNHRLNTQKQT